MKIGDTVRLNTSPKWTGEVLDYDPVSQRARVAFHNLDTGEKATCWYPRGYLTVTKEYTRPKKGITTFWKAQAI